MGDLDLYDLHGGAFIECRNSNLPEMEIYGSSYTDYTITEDLNGVLT